MVRLPDALVRSPGRIAGGYLVFGVVWIAITDTLVVNLAGSQAELTRLQTIKGWVFVLASTVVIFALTYSRQRQVNEERGFTDLALDSLRDIFVVLDTDGTIQRVNERAVAVTKYAESELIGMDARQLIAPEDRDSLSTAIDSAFDGVEHGLEAILLTKDDRRILYEFRGRRFLDRPDAARGLAVIGRDIADRKLNEQRLLVALRVLRHDLRNQLNVIQGWADDIGRADDDAEIRQNILESTDNLLEMSRKARRMAELGDDGPDGSRQVDIDGEISTIVNEYREQYPTASFETDLASNALVETNGFEFETAVRNALENAVEHNGTSDPWVRVETTLESDLVRIALHDDGPGLPLNEQVVLETGVETPLQHGSGLGLWLIQWAMRELGGSVKFEDREPTGTTVTLELPAA